jgi:hypothetical protein
MAPEILLEPKPFLRRLRLRHWGWVHAKIALGLGWTHAMLLSPPESYQDQVSQFTLVTWTMSTAVGAIVSLVGLFLTFHLRRAVASWGLTLEVIGLALFAGGPFQYMLIQIGFAVDGNFADRYALIWFAYSMLAFIIARAAIIVPGWVEEATGFTFLPRFRRKQK